MWRCPSSHGRSSCASYSRSVVTVDTATIVSTVLAATSATVAVVATYFARRQWRAAEVQAQEARRAATLSAILPFYLAYQDDRVQRVRARLEKRQLDFSRLSAADEADIRDLLRRLEFLAALVSVGLVDLDAVRATFWYSVPNVWKQVLPYIEYRRFEGENPIPNYAKNYEELVRAFEQAEGPSK